jgi:TRAP transporter TAXI family solute receptor
MVITSRLQLLGIVSVWIIVLGGAVLYLTNSEKKTISLGAGNSDSETFELATAIAAVLNGKSERFVIDVFETGGAAENLRLLSTGKIDLATTQADATMPDNVVGVAKLYHDAYHLIVSSETEIKDFSDLRRHRIAIPPESSGQHDSFWFMVDHYGLSAKKFTALPMADDAANFAMIQGQVDAVFRVRAPGNNMIRDLISRHEMRLVPIEQSLALSLKQPAISQGLIPVGSYRGHPALPIEDLNTAVLDRLLVARAGLDDELVFELTGGLFDYRSELLVHSKLAGFIGPLKDDSASVLPAHDGARRYYNREKPGFLRENARVVSALLYAAVILSSGIIALRSYWLKIRRVRMSDYTHRLMDVSMKVRDESDLNRLLESKHELMDVLSEVVVELDKHRVSQEEFEHFSFTWQAVDALVRDRFTLSGHSVKAG